MMNLLQNNPELANDFASLIANNHYGQSLQQESSTVTTADFLLTLRDYSSSSPKQSKYSLTESVLYTIDESHIHDQVEEDEESELDDIR